MFSHRRPNRSSSPQPTSRSGHVSRKARGLAGAGAQALAGAFGRRGHGRGKDMVEALEPRTLLTTITSGPGQSRTFEYLDSDDNVNRIVLTGNITAEFIALWVADRDNDAPLSTTRNIIRDLVTPGELNPLDPMGDEELPGADLFAIYISEADPDATLVIAKVPDVDADDRPMQAFNGSVDDFRAVNARTGRSDMFGPEGSSGSVLIGAQTANTIEGTTNEEKRAILSQPLTRRIGVRPASAKGKLDAGISTAPGVSIGQIMIGGTVTGRVFIDGSIDTFYAGQIWTGDTTGILATEAPTITQNFVINGDCHQIISLGSIGTTDLTTDGTLPDFKTGVDIRVKGRLGTIMTKGSFLGATVVTGDKSKPLNTVVHEIEVVGRELDGWDSYFETPLFGATEQETRPSLGDNPIFRNDTFGSAQFLGTKLNGSVTVLGELADFVQDITDRYDVYAMPLMAGQNVQVQLTEGFNSFDPSTGQGLNDFTFDGLSLSTGVFDPDGHLIATDSSNQDVASTLHQPFRFTAKSPGVYYFVVTRGSDVDYNGATNTTGSNVEGNGGVGFVPYQLDISGAGNLALGGIVGQSVANLDAGLIGSTTPSFQVKSGDLGALYASGAGIGTSSGGDGGVFAFSNSPVTVNNGNLRTITAATIGTARLDGTTAVFGFGVDLAVPKGSVGLIRSTGTGFGSAVMLLNGYDTSLTPVLPDGSFNPKIAIGGSYQVVDCGTTNIANLLANGGIGQILSDSVSGITLGSAPRWAVNVDRKGNDGIIDLIDVRSSLGSLEVGGPMISTGPGGNVRYIHVAQGALVFRDQFFGLGTDRPTTLTPGKSFNYVDDSGAQVKITPLPEAFDTQGNAINPASLTVMTYGIRDKGGSVLINVSVSGGATTTGVEQAGIQVTAGTNGGTGSAEIGSVDFGEVGAPVSFAAATRTFATDTTASLGTTLTLKGKVNVDVFDVNANNLNSVNNLTNGEIVNITANTIGTIAGFNLGVAKSFTGATIQGVDIKRDSYPFNQQRTLIQATAINGPIQSIKARGALGNVFAAGTIGEVEANSDGRNDKTLFEGLVAPIESGQHILSANIGEGLPYSGSGNVAFAGLFASGVIAKVTNQGLGSDIRGNIVANGTSFLPAVTIADLATGIPIVTEPAVASIGDIELKDGAIIDANIAAVTDFIDAQDQLRAITLQGSAVIDLDNPINNVNSINIVGKGGIIGTRIDANNIGNINIKGGFGLIDSTINLQATSTFDGVVTDGFGIRFTTVAGGNTTDHIVARGDGRVLQTTAYTPSVRNSERVQFDPFTGRLLSRLNDLHRFAGTTAHKPKNSRTTVAGSIEDVLVSGGRDLHRLEAYRLKATGVSPVLPGQGSIGNGNVQSTMRISFANQVGKIIVHNSIDGLQFTAGNVSSVQVDRDVMNTAFSIDSVMGTFSCNNFKSSASLRVEGGEGRIDHLITKRAMFGRVFASTRINKTTIGTDLSSRTFQTPVFNTLTVNGSILDGALVRATNRIDSLIVGHNIDKGATIRAKRIANQQIKGQLLGAIITG